MNMGSNFAIRISITFFHEYEFEAHLRATVPFYLNGALVVKADCSAMSLRLTQTS